MPPWLELADPARDYACRRSSRSSFIGSMFSRLRQPGVPQYNLWDAESSSSIIYNATLCQEPARRCSSASRWFRFAAVAADGNVYIGDGGRVLIFDSVANPFATPTRFHRRGVTRRSPITGSLRTAGAASAADTSPRGRLRQWSGAHDHFVVAHPGSGEPRPPTVTITEPTSKTSLVVSTCLPAPSRRVMSRGQPTQITATFAINPVGPLGACNITVNTTGGAPAPSAGSSFTVLIDPVDQRTPTPSGWPLRCGEHRRRQHGRGSIADSGRDHQQHRGQRRRHPDHRQLPIGGRQRLGLRTSS